MPDRRLRRPKLARSRIPSVCLRRLRSAYTEPAIAWVSSTMLAMVEGKALPARPAMSSDMATKTDAVSQLAEDDELALGGAYFHRRCITFTCLLYDHLLTCLP